MSRPANCSSPSSERLAPIPNRKGVPCAVRRTGLLGLSKNMQERRRFLHGNGSRQSFAARRRRKKGKCRFFRGHVPWEKHFSACKCANAVSARRRLHPLEKMPAFLRSVSNFFDTLRQSRSSLRLCFSSRGKTKRKITRPALAMKGKKDYTRYNSE